MTAGSRWTHYDIHEAVRFRTNVQPVNIPSYFRTGPLTPNFELALVDELSRPEDGRARRVVGYTAYELGEGAMFYECDVPVMDLFGTGTRWTFRMSGLADDDTRIETAVPFFGFQPVRFRVTQLLSKLVNLLLTLKLIRSGYAMCHATSLAADGRAHLLFGYSGTGKSTLASLLLDRGYEFMSDDFAMVAADGSVLCYPDWRRPRPMRPIPLLRYLVPSRPYVRPGLRIRDRADVDTILFLERGRDGVVEIDEAEALRRVLLMNTEEISKMWNSPITVLLNHYAYFYPDLDFVSLMARYREAVASFVGRARQYLSVTSSSPGFEVLRGILEEKP
jgi:hypothetical protein